MNPMMIRLLLTLIILAVSFNAIGKPVRKPLKQPVKIAVIDTGFGYEQRGREAKLCVGGHQDFSGVGILYNVNGTTVPADTLGHGTNIVGIIESFAKKAHINYCIVILKYYRNDGFGSGNLKATIEALKVANQLGVKYINYSGSGADPSDEERAEIIKFLNNGGTFVAAAGNDSHLLGKESTYYPAMYDPRIVVVGSTDKNGAHLSSSNYGPLVNRWEVGMGVIGYGLSMSGTSQATAVATGKIVAKDTNRCDIGK